MAKFVFKLQAVLDMRQRTEDDCQRRLAQLLNQRTQLQNQIRDIQHEIVESKQQLTDTLVGTVDLTRVGHFARFSGQATMRATQIVRELAAFEKHVDAARLSLLDASKARKALELLHDKQSKAWAKQQDRFEAAALDEMAVQSKARNRLSGASDGD